MTKDNVLALFDFSKGYLSMTLEEKVSALNKIDIGWDELSDDKYNIAESAMVAIMMLDEYLKMGKPELAKKWGDVLINDKNRPDCGEKELIKGKILFESGQLDEAKELFKIAFQKSKGRIFAAEPKKYVDLLKK
jgi:tetratricopeptide (TPR) repeat protein